MSNEKKILHIIRGLPGSGKTSLAKILETGYKESPDLIKTFRVETDDFWVYLGNGVYSFDNRFLKEAHEWCKNQVFDAMLKGTQRIIVSNTFTTQSEVEPYVEMATKFEYAVQIITLQGPWESEHNVPYDVVLKMQERFETINKPFGGE